MTEAQTVGQIATNIIDTYMKSGGYFYGPLGRNSQPGFAEYWKEHAGRSTSAGWWSVRLARAAHATRPTPSDRHAAIKRLRTQIDALSNPDRALTLLRLNGDAGADTLVSREELVSALKELGPDTLLDYAKPRAGHIDTRTGIHEVSRGVRRRAPTGTCRRSLASGR
jgi:hypothetical protein